VYWKWEGKGRTAHRIKLARVCRNLDQAKIN
jgi:hypothetical protein